MFARRSGRFISEWKTHGPNQGSPIDVEDCFEELLCQQSFAFRGGHFGPGPRQDKDSPPRDLGRIRSGRARIVSSL